jgi:protein O-GlcNAc transferase
LADIALDTRIVGGAATTSDALWAGVPVICLIGRHFASRMSASLINAVGLPELVCDSLNAYESLAVDLANDRQRLFELRAKLSRNIMTEPLFDSARTVRSLERAYARMWEDYTQGTGPQSFTVPTN